METLYHLSSHSPFPPLPEPLWTTNLLCLFWIFHISKIIQHDSINMAFCIWLLSLSKMFSRFIHIVAYIRSLFLLMVKLYSTVCIYCILFIHSSVHGHLRCSHLLDIMNRVVMIICVQDLLESILSITLGINLRVELMSYMLILCLMYWGITKVFSTMAP